MEAGCCDLRMRWGHELWPYHVRQRHRLLDANLDRRNRRCSFLKESSDGLAPRSSADAYQAAGNGAAYEVGMLLAEQHVGLVGRRVSLSLTRLLYFRGLEYRQTLGVYLSSRVGKSIEGQPDLDELGLIVHVLQRPCCCTKKLRVGFRQQADETGRVPCGVLDRRGLVLTMTAPALWGRRRYYYLCHGLG